MNPVRSVVVGIGIGLAAVLTQLWIVHGSSAQAPLLRGLLPLTVAILIGAIAGLAGKAEAIKIAALMGFVSGALLSSSNLVFLAADPNVIAQHPFASAETAFAFVSSVLAGTMIGSWIIAGFAALVALSIRSAQRNTVRA